MLYIIKLKVEVKFILHTRKAVCFAEIRALNYKSVFWVLILFSKSTK